MTPLVEGLSGVVVGEIEAIEREVLGDAGGHENRLCRVALPDRKLSVLCGAPNAAPGLRTALRAARRHAARRPRHRRATRSAARAPRACSARSRSWASARTATASSSCPPTRRSARTSSTYLGLDDTILEIEITPNRPDALSIVGVAREVAALTGAPFRFPQVAVKEAETEAATLATVRDRRSRPAARATPRA